MNVSLENLLKIGQLAEHQTDRQQLGKMLASADRFLQDARHESVSLETRLSIAYTAISYYATLALWANGYRPSTSAPGHHQTIIQSLVHSIDLDSGRMALLDTFRVKRNAIDYSGGEVDEGSVLACVDEADRLRDSLLNWLQENRPELLG
jgi:hypothetical protein